MSKETGMAGEWRSPKPRDDATDIAALIADIKLAADQLALTGVDRGDVKLLARSFRELQDCLSMMRKYEHRRKVTVFGSARTKPTHPAYRQACEFGERMAVMGYYVITGAGPGIMEAAHVGAGRENSIGFNIRLPFEQGANAVVEGDSKLRTLNYFFTRKLLFLKDTDAIVLFPGGFGTLDEGFETLTLIQTGRAKSLPVIMIDAPGESYWKAWRDYVESQLLAPGWISPEDMSLFFVTDNIDAAIEEIQRFYRVYHSQRYVENKLVLRLKSAIGDADFHRLEKEFADLLAPGGTFARSSAHHYEENEPAIKHLPRLRLGFNRRNFGRLRQMIDWLNREIAPPVSFPAASMEEMPR